MISTTPHPAGPRSPICNLMRSTRSAQKLSMPELPEVETSRAYVEEFCLGSVIVKCHTTEQGGGPVS